MNNRTIKAIRELQPNWFAGAVMVLFVLVLGSLVFWGDKRLAPTRAESSDLSGAITQANPNNKAATTNPAPTPPPPRPHGATAGQVGIDALALELGIATPLGRNINIAHVEGNLGDYMPNAGDPGYEPTLLVPRSGPSKANGHTQATASIIYGRNGLAPAVGEAHFFVTNHWLTFGCLNSGTLNPPDPGNARISTHSWIGSLSPVSIEVLRRLDYMIDTSDVIAVVGVNNGNTSEVPALLGSGYNVIAVGHPQGNSSGGYTRIEGVGRCKPDLVAPGGLTSFTTPVVTAVVARLLETADRRNDAPMARKSEVIRALLLTGASKPGGWKQETGKPLDQHLGAGMVRLDQSYRILTDGPMVPGAVPPRGWSFLNMKPGGSKVTFEIQLLSPAGEVSLIAAWNRRVDGRVIDDMFTGQKRWSDAPRLGQFDLILERVRRDGQTEVVTDSTSSIDNVQHVYRPFLAPGKYRIHLVRKDALNEDYEVALAWRIEPGEGK